VARRREATGYVAVDERMTAPEAVTKSDSALSPLLWPRAKETTMSKEQKRGNREVRKPKSIKATASPAATAAAGKNFLPQVKKLGEKAKRS
jgi:hypothetical protein